MSNDAINRALKAPTKNQLERHVLTVLANRADAKTFKCIPLKGMTIIKTLIVDTQMSRTTLWRALEGLSGSNAAFIRRRYEYRKDKSKTFTDIYLGEYFRRPRRQEEDASTFQSETPTPAPEPPPTFQSETSTFQVETPLSHCPITHTPISGGADAPPPIPDEVSSEHVQGNLEQPAKPDAPPEEPDSGQRLAEALEQQIAEAKAAADKRERELAAATDDLFKAARSYRPDSLGQAETHLDSKSSQKGKPDRYVLAR